MDDALKEITEALVHLAMENPLLVPLLVPVVLFALGILAWLSIEALSKPSRKLLLRSIQKHWRGAIFIYCLFAVCYEAALFSARKRERLREFPTKALGIVFVRDPSMIEPSTALSEDLLRRFTGPLREIVDSEAVKLNPADDLGIADLSTITARVNEVNGAFAVCFARAAGATDVILLPIKSTALENEPFHLGRVPDSELNALDNQPVALRLAALIKTEGAYRFLAHGEYSQAAEVLEEVLAMPVQPSDGAPSEGHLRRELARALLRRDGATEPNLHRMASLYDQALHDSTLDPGVVAELWQERGTTLYQMAGPDRRGNLLESVKSFDKALELRRSNPKNLAWAQLLENRAAAALELAPLEDESAGRLTLCGAWRDLKAASTFLKGAYPKEWATTVFDLAMIESRSPQEGRDSHLREAIEDYRKCLSVFTESGFPEEWAATMNNLGSAYRTLPSGDRPQNLKVALEYFYQALRVRTRLSRPLQWAATYQNCGLVYIEQGDLSRAIEAFDQVLDVLDKKLYPQQWAIVASSLAEAYTKGPGRPCDVQTAVRLLDDAIPVLESGHYKAEAQNARKTLSQARKELGADSRDGN